MKQVLVHFIAFLLWNGVYGAALLLAPAPWGVAGAALATAVYLGWVVFPRGAGRQAARRAATLRLRNPAPATRPWLAAAVPTVLVLSGALDIVYGGLVRVDPLAYNPFSGLEDTPMGRLSIAVVGVVLAPLVEEFVFRGLVQRPLERRWGAAWGVGVAAVLFAFAHAIPSALPLYLFLGAAFGFAVYATGSIWSGVVLHAANNALALASLGFPVVWERGPTPDWWRALAVLLLAVVVAGWVARGMLRARRSAGRPPFPGGAHRAVAPDPS